MRGVIRNLFSSRAKAYDQLQPLRIEMYEFYHQLALDFLPFALEGQFRLLELGCGTGTFLNRVLEHYPNADCLAVDYSDEMLTYASQKVTKHQQRVEFHQRDLNQGLPPNWGPFELVTSVFDDPSSHQ